MNSSADDICFALESLYEHQDHDWVVDAVPHVLAWVDPIEERSAPQRFRFQVQLAEASGSAPKDVGLALEWDLGRLEERDGNVRGKAARLRSGRTVDRERLAETAAYGLALVAISVFLPGRKVVSMERFRCPDFLLDATPGAYRGVEVAGRSQGGFGALRAVRLEKTPQLLSKADLVEAYLSLWCTAPRVGEFHGIKP